MDKSKLFQAMNDRMVEAIDKDQVISSIGFAKVMDEKITADNALLIEEAVVEFSKRIKEILE